jgi:putative sigma-54 modulation protein
MNVEYTGRHYEITPAIRKEVETGLQKIRKILSDKFETKVILVVEKRRHKAEITISPRNGPLVALAQAGDMSSAISQAIEHLEKQAIKYKTRWRTKKRKPVDKWNGAAEPESPQRVNGKPVSEVVPILVHRYPAISKSTEVHLAPATDSVARRPMTVEEAIKEAHFRDRDVFVFRDPKGKVMVLHRTREGKMELIEAP